MTEICHHNDGWNPYRPTRRRDGGAVVSDPHREPSCLPYHFRTPGAGGPRLCEAKLGFTCRRRASHHEAPAKFSTRISPSTSFARTFLRGCSPSRRWSSPGTNGSSPAKRWNTLRRRRSPFDRVCGGSPVRAPRDATVRDGRCVTPGEKAPSRSGCNPEVALRDYPHAKR